VPKLSKNSLEKRFACQHCGKSCRTRQGLSGHIQFKHGAGKESPQINHSYVLSKGKYWEKVGKAAGLPMSEIRAKQHIMVEWFDVQAFCNFFKIKLSNSDFKNYLIASLAHMHASEHLKEQLINSLKQFHQEWMEDESG